MTVRKQKTHLIDSLGNIVPNSELFRDVTTGTYSVPPLSVDEVSRTPQYTSPSFKNTTDSLTSSGGVPLTLASLFAKGKQLVNNNWSAKGGLNLQNIPGIGNINVGKYAPWIQGIASTGQAIGGISDYNNAKSDYDDLTGSILREANSNPLANYYLTNSQQSDLRKLQRDGNIGGKADIDDFLNGMGSGLGDAILPTLLGLATGGVPGALVGGIGSLVNSGIGGMKNRVAQDTADLEALYQTLADAKSQYSSMKRIPMQGLGLQQQYAKMYQ